MKYKKEKIAASKANSTQKWSGYQWVDSSASLYIFLSPVTQRQDCNKGVTIWFSLVKGIVTVCGTGNSGGNTLPLVSLWEYKKAARYSTCL